MKKRIFVLMVAVTVMMSGCGSPDGEASEGAQGSEPAVTAEMENREEETGATTQESDEESETDSEESEVKIESDASQESTAAAAVSQHDAESGEDEEEEVMEATLSGSFAVVVWDVIPDYSLDDKNHQCVIALEFQGSPFIMRVDEEIGSQLETKQIYVFTIEPKVVDMHKECLEKLSTASLLWEFHPTIKEFRLGTQDDYGLAGPMLTVE